MRGKEREMMRFDGPVDASADGSAVFDHSGNTARIGD